jgi:ketosteroid isomerase-like protein
MTTATQKSGPSAPGDTVEGVRAAIAAYCHALDDGRVDDLVALFTADGTSALPGMEPVTGTEALRALYLTVTPQGPQRHLVLNTLVSAERDGEVEAVSDLVFLRSGEGGWSVALVGRYQDVLRGEGGSWRFARRTLSFTAA